MAAAPAIAQHHPEPRSAWLQPCRAASQPQRGSSAVVGHRTCVPWYHAPGRKGEPAAPGQCMLQTHVRA
eukprot:1161350-Pelagomonas_calceolata.AAC.4